MSSRRASAIDRRGASTFLEVQIALIVFAVGVSGLIPLNIANTRQARVASERLSSDAIHYVTPPDNSWAAKLGASSHLKTTVPTTRTKAVELVDDKDAAFVRTSRGRADWWWNSTNTAYAGGYWLNAGDGAGDRGNWTMSGLEPCRYEVWVTYPPSATHASNARFIVYDNQTELFRTRLNQRVAPTGPNFNGVPWTSLGSYVIRSGTVRVMLTDSADGLVAADAVRVSPKKYQLQVLSQQQSAGDQTMSVTVSATAP